MTLKFRHYAPNSIFKTQFQILHIAHSNPGFTR